MVEVPQDLSYSLRHIRGHGSGNSSSTIQFRFTSPKNLAFTNKLAMLVTFALKELGQGKITEPQIAQLKLILAKESKEKMMADAALMPAWIRTIIKNAYE